MSSQSMNRRRHSHESENGFKPSKKPNHGRGASSSTMGSKASPERKGKASNQPLRRGDACLMCRAKKLKCSATKPVCDQCAKRKDRCVYDAIRPASRVEKLEKKLAEMEEAELKAAIASRRHSAADALPSGQASGSLNWSNGATSSENAPSNLGAYSDYARLFPSFSGPANSVTSSSTDAGTSPYGGMPRSIPSGERTAANMMDSLGNWNWPSGSRSGGNSTQPPNGDQPYGSNAPTLEGMPWSLLSSSNDVSTVWSMDMSQPVPAQPTPINPTATGTATPVDPAQSLGLGFDLDPSMGFQLTQTLKGVDNHARQSLPLPTQGTQITNTLPIALDPQASLEPHITPFDSAIPSQTGKEAINEVLDRAVEHRTTLTEDDISQSAREYLLDLFFCPPRVAFGSEVWSEEQFRAKMALPPKLRPHPCLVFSMYTLAASSSYIPAVRALADSLYLIALVKLDEAVAEEDRLLDAINAAKGLGKWQFSRARPLEGFYLTNKAIMLALACNLHRIKTGIFRSHEQIGSAANAAWPLLGPPKDQWELAERIHSFWSVYCSDRGAACMTKYPNFLDESTITTPLPRPPEEYINGTVTNHPEFRLRDIYLLSTMDDLSPPSYMYGTLICSLHLCWRARILCEKSPEGINNFTALALAAYAQKTSPTPPPPYCARRDHPAAYKEIMEATYAIERKMADELKIKQGSDVVWDAIDAPLSHSCLMAARMLLHSLDADAFDRDSAIQHARDYTQLVKSWAKALQVDDPDTPSPWRDDKVADSSSIAHVTTRTKNGIGGPYILTGWFWSADILLKGATILNSLGRHDEARAVSEDAATVVKALKSVGVLYKQAQEGESRAFGAEGGLGA
ncbi:hypothetical protein BD324DRAFT_631038 [Kockovaella imperatae]|uniref:Zn(2)-C6 fungal-type domain-containing protein n=1 Tax=Kockovaella imperatae TaxID=4999 RepID=A0A1Y1UCB8_9TREE|nr:hypothetical protein BD324DRAFT_631038 [Kockovaella imperatae]ORX35659.1 hypothetical protein BD324DRAFT_631038 [Kockovaella imperatae]